MGKGITEFPGSDILERKYLSSWTVFEDKNGLLSLEYVAGVVDATTLSDELRRPIKRQPVYYPFEPGYYTNENKDPFPCVYFLHRHFNHHKQYKVGLSDASWRLIRIPLPHGEKQQVSIDARIKLDIFGSSTTLKEVGILDRQYLFTKQAIFHRERMIGMRNNKTLVVDHPAFKFDLKEKLDRSWVIS